MTRYLLLVLTSILLVGCGSVPLTFSGEEAYQQAVAQSDLGPRPTGSEAGWATGNYILARLGELGWETEEQPTTFQGVKVRNIVGRAGQGPVIIVGAHYDTRPYADRDQANPEQWIMGGNDGASGVAVLLELARVLDKKMLHNEVWLSFFDAEDRGNLDGWPFSVGAAYMAEHLEITPQVVIVLDMVGDRDQQFYFERNSDHDLQAVLWDIAADLGYQEQFIPKYKWTIIDDHLPFKELGIPAVDVIDFDYAAWHTAGDTLDQTSAESLERIGRVVEEYLERRDSSLRSE